MARIPYFDPAQAEGPRAQQAFTRIGENPANIFRMLGHAGEMIDGWTKLGNQILRHASLDPVLREIAIIRTGVLMQSDYEVFQHKRLGRGIGMSPELLAAIDEGADAAGLTDIQRKVIRFTDDVVTKTRASDESFAAMQGELATKALQELTITIGYYMMVCVYLKTFDVEIEERYQAKG